MKKLKRVTINITETQYNKLAKLADIKDITYNGLIRLAINEYLKKNKI